MREFLALPCLLLSCALAACAGDEETLLAPLAEAAPLEPAPPAEPLYAVTGTSFGPEGNSSYVALVSSLAPDTRIDYRRVLELPGGTSLFGSDRDGFFAVGAEEQPTITRFDVGDAGGFLQRDTLSLAPYGLGYMWRDPGLVPFIAADKAYVIDAQTASVVIWNPAAMVLTGSFAIDGVLDPAFPDTAFEPDPTRRGDQLLIAATHSSETASAPFSSLVVLDVQRDEVVSVAREERCGGLWNSVQAANGDIYYATGAWDAAQHRAYGEAVAAAPCVVRVKAGETTFDPDFLVRASELTLGSATGALVAGPGDTAYVKALDESLLPPAADFDALWSAAAWRWWRLDLGTRAGAAPVDGIEPASAGGGELSVEGKAYVLNVAQDLAETTLFDLSAAGGPQRMLTVRGWPYGIVRVR
ncbi:MAG TPA: hypothetical protein VFS67_12235 [Polyangiaceae bacterium]|nr:hypothetical protein [Polyangiaceae bacterium]